MTRKTRISRHPRIAVLGSRSAFTRRAVSALCESGIPPVALMIGAGAAPEVRGPIPTEVPESNATAASAHGISLIRASNPNHPAAVSALERMAPDLLLLACLPCIVTRATRETARLGALNLHPSALPRFRGPDPVFWQLRAGLRRVAATVHIATDTVDAGPILAQPWLEVRPGIRAEELTSLLVRLGIRALVKLLPSIERRIGDAVPQDESAATRQPFPGHQDFRIETTWSAERAYRFIEGTRGPGIRFTILRDAGELEIERAVGFGPPSRAGPARERSDGIVSIRFARGALRVVPARSRQNSTSSSSSNPKVDMSRMRDG